MFSGSYDPEDVTFLLKPIELAETPLVEKERLIQSGQRHYSEMITREQLPSLTYLQHFHAGLAREHGRLARDLITLAGQLADRLSGSMVLISLARAGTPIGILLARTLRRQFDRAVKHYSVSIVRDRGIDEAALRYVLDRHPAAAVAFVDGWTGKGVIAAELGRAVRRFNAATGSRLNSDLFAVADLSGTASGAATTEDYLIPSCVLGATVSGLISRSILNDRVCAAGDFHGCLYYREFEREDLSRWFVDVMTVAITDQWRQGRRPANCEPDESRRASMRQRRAAFLAHALQRYAVGDIRFLKPGIGEATRVLLRRVPERLLLRDAQAPEVAHLRFLAEEKKVPVVTDLSLPYKAAALVKALDQ